MYFKSSWAVVTDCPSLFPPFNTPINFLPIHFHFMFIYVSQLETFKSIFLTKLPRKCIYYQNVLHIFSPSQKKIYTSSWLWGKLFNFFFFLNLDKYLFCSTRQACHSFSFGWRWLCLICFQFHPVFFFFFLFFSLRCCWEGCRSDWLRWMLVFPPLPLPGWQMDLSLLKHSVSIFVTSDWWACVR